MESQTQNNNNNGVSPVVVKVGVVTETDSNYVHFDKCENINIRVANIYDKIRMYRHKLCHVDPEHQIENCTEYVGKWIDKHELLYDFELEYELRKLFVRFRRQPIKSYPRPKFVPKDRWGNEVWWKTVFSGKYRNKKENDLYVDSWNYFDYDASTHHRFTFGNFEYAARVTKYLWHERTKFVGKLEKREFIRFQICYRFLTMLHQYKSGRFAYLNRWTDEINEVHPQDVERYVEEKMLQKYGKICYGKPEFLDVDTEECKTLDEHLEKVTERVAEITDVSSMVDITPGFFTTEATEHVVENVDRILSQQPKKEPPIALSTVTVNEPDFTLHRCPRIFKDKWYDPVDNPFGKLRRSYFTELCEVYLHIGRPDLAARHQALMTWSWRRKPQIPRRTWDHNLAQNMQRTRNGVWVRNRLRAGGHELRLQQFEQRFDDEYNEMVGQFGDLEAEMDVQPVVMGSCIRPARRTKILRFLTNLDPLFQRHLDKMIVMCTKIPHDALLFHRQKRIILTIDPHLINEAIDTIGKVNNFAMPVFPSYYVPQAQLMKKRLLRCAVNPTDENIWNICQLVRVMIDFWCTHEYEAWRCQCWGTPTCTDLEAQSAEQPPLKSTPGPTPGSAKDGVTAPSTKQAPIIDGEKKVTMTMVDQRDKEEATVKDTRETKLSKATMPESLYDLEDIGKRPMLIDRFQWNAKDPLGTVYKAWLMPYTYFNANSKKPTVCQNMNAAYVLSMYGVVRFDMVFRIQINSTKFQQGILKFVWKPFFDASRRHEVFDNLTGYPSVDIRANESNTVELTVPWSHFRDAFPTYTDNHLEWAYLGGLGCVVWNQLKTGDNGSKDADVTLWMYLKNLQVHQLTNPKPPGKIMFASTILGMRDDEENRALLQEGEYRFTKKEVWEAQALETDVVGSLIGMGADIVKDTGAQLVENLLNRISGKPNCKPITPVPPLPVYPMVMENLANCEGIEPTTRLDVYPIAGDKPTPEQYRAVNLKEMTQVWTRIATGSWKTSDDVNKSLFACPVTPSIVSGEDDFDRQYGVGSYIFEDWNPPESSCTPNYHTYTAQVYRRNGCFLDYLARMFFYWRGDIKYKIEFVGTAMHSGRLLIRYEPYGSSESAKQECEKASTPGLAWDIEEKHELIFTVPYASNQEWLQTNYLSEGGVTDSQMGLSFMGLWEIIVLNKLRATAGISAECDVNVYIAAGENFKFYQLCPLDGVIGFRDHIADKADPPRTTVFQKFIDTLWYWVESWTLPNEEDSSKVTIPVTPPVTVWLPNTKMLGPGASHKYEELEAAYLQFNYAWKNQKAKVEAWEDITFPYFTTHAEAYTWLRMLGDTLPFKIKYMMQVAKWTPSKIELQKIYWYMSLALLPPQVLMSIEDYPEVNEYFGRIVTSFSEPQITFPRDLEAQSKSSKGGGINPFLTEHVSKESYNTADHMDMYRNLKRPVIWGTFQVPRPLGTSAVDNAYKRAEQENNIYEWASLTSYERENAWWEFRIPVTPMLKFHQIGEKGHWFVAPQWKGSERDRSKVFPIENGGANVEGGSNTSMTPLRMLSELFTFWHGDLRYKFIFRNMYRKDGNPWQAYIMHHPTQFTRWDPTGQNYKLVTDTRRRNMTQLGTVLFSGNVMSQISVEVPFASMFRKLYLTERYNEQFTDNGSLLIYIPFVTNGFEVCDPKNMTPESIDKFGMEGLSFSVAVSIGETFEFENLRAPPQQLLWPRFWRRKVEPDHTDWGWAEISNYKAGVLDVPKPEAVRRYVRGENTELEQYAPIHSFTKMITKKTNLTMHEKMPGAMKTARKFNPSMLLKWINSMMPKEKEENDLVAEMMESGESSQLEVEKTDPKLSSLPPSEFLATAAKMDPEKFKNQTLDDIDGVASSTLQAVALSLKDFHEATQAIKESSKMFCNIAESVGETTKTVKSSSSVIGKAAKWSFDATRMVIFFNGLTQLLKAKDWNERFLPISQCAISLGISADVITSAGRWLMDWFTGVSTEREDEKVNDLNAESWEDTWNSDWAVFIDENAQTLKLIAAAIITFLTFYMTSSAPTSKTSVTGFASNMLTKLRNFTIVGAAIKSFDWLFKWIGSVVKDAAEIAGNWATGGKLIEYRMSAHYPEVVEWMRKITKYESDVGLTHLCWDTQERFELWKRMDEGTYFMDQLGVKSGPLYNTLLRGMKVLQAAHDKAQSLVEIPSFRFDPFHICIFGEAGYGKSSILNQILTFMCNESNLPQKHRFYQRNPDDDFWTNYCGQACVVIDDYQQRTDAPANKELISMKSNQPWPLNMADMKEKGRQFSSVIVGSTTNVLFPKSDKQADNTAIWRRRDMLLEITSVKEGSKDPNDLRFTQLVANPKRGAVKIPIPGRSNMTLEQTMVAAAESFLAHSNLQYALVFGNLRQRVVEIDLIPDVVDSPKPKCNSFDDWMQLISTANLNPDAVEKLVQMFSEKEIIDNMDKYPILKTTKTFNTIIAKMQMLDLDQIQSKEQMVTLCKVACDNIDRARFDAIILWDQNTHKWIEWKDDDIDITKKVGYIDNEAVCWVTKTVFEELLERRAEGLMEDMLKSTEKRIEGNVQAHQERIQKARAQVTNYTKSVAFMQGVLQEHVESVPKRKYYLTDKKAIEDYCKTLHHLTEQQKDQMKNDIDKIYNYVNQDKIEEIVEVGKSKDFGILFAPKNNMYWKKDKQDNWKMEFPTSEMNDEAYELETLYDVMTMAWSQKQINEAKNSLPVLEKAEDGRLIKFMKWCNAKRETLQTWWDKHPNIQTALKFAAMMGGIFIGYNVLFKLFPGVMTQLRDAFMSMFNWVTGRSTESRVQDAKEFVKGQVTRFKVNLKEYYDMIRNFMRSSKDQDVRQMADDDQAVHMLAESLMNKCETQAQLIKVQKAIAEGKDNLKKIIPTNPYVLSNVTPYHTEGGEKQMSELSKEAQVPILKLNDMMAHGSTDVQAETFRKSIIRNMVMIQCLKDGKNREMRALFIRGRTMLVPSHFFLGLEENAIISIRFANLIFYQMYEPHRKVDVPGQDLVLYECTTQIGTYKDIVNSFVTELDLEQVRRTRASLNIQTDYGLITQFGDIVLGGEVDYKLGDQTLMCNRAWGHNFETEPGVCGAVVMAQNSHLQRKILGIHVAGSKSTNSGAAAIVTQEELHQLLKELPVECKVKASGLVPECLITRGYESMKVVPEGNIELIGAVSENKSVRLPHKTEIEPSVIHGLVRDPVTAPAVLTRNDPRNKSGESPLIKAISKYGKLTLPYQPSHRRLVKQDLLFDVLNWELGMEVRKLTDHEAAWGNDTIPYCERMNMKASPGYPWTLSRPSGEMGKAYLFDINARDGIANEQYRYEYQAREKLAKVGIRKHSLWTDCLKDERRSLDKIEKGKTRAFMLPPADFVQLFRKYFMAFGVTFYHNHCKTFSAVGLDPYSFDWTRLSRRLRKKAKYFFGGDFHNFDGTLNPEIMWDIYQIIEEWYKRNDPNWSEEDEMVRQVLWYETMHTVHICLNSVYVTHQGNPSGNPFTVVINTLYHAAVMRLVYIEIMMLLGLITLANMYFYKKYIVDIFYGDDGLVGVAKLIMELFNLLTVQERFRAHGIEYTSEDKVTTYTVRSLEECTFLKNGFVKLEKTNFWLAPISQDTIYELTNWVHKSDDPVGQLRENIQTALRFAFHHGKEFYDRFGKVCAEACLARRVRPVSYSYEHQLAEFVQKCTE